MEEIDFDSRRLCPDESCIGVLDDNGVCKECGLSAEGKEAVKAVKSVVAKVEESIDATGDDDRELCPDGNCIGLIGPDGRCKECGTRRGS